MFVSDVSNFKFVGKVKPAFFIVKEEVNAYHLFWLPIFDWTTFTFLLVQ